MKKTVLLIVVLIGIALTFFVLSRNNGRIVPPPSSTNNISQNKENPEDVPVVSVVAENLDTPWGMVFLPDNSVLITERKGTVRRINSEGVLEEEPVVTLSSVREISEGGLLGIDVHPDFATNNYVYLYYTYDGNGSTTLNRVIRMNYQNNSLTSEATIVDAIPGAPNHNGGRIKFGPDKYLYIATGDAQEPSLAQNTGSLAGKILRVDGEGNPHSQNPFSNRIYSYGHRNVQGLAWDEFGHFWSTEHGRSAPSGYDELNLIKAGQNYGWPDFEGDESSQGMTSPIRHSGATNTWAPAGIAFVGNSVYFGGLRGEGLYKSVISGEQAGDVQELFKNEFGRIREVIKGPDNMLYISTSNRDGRGSADETDDKIIRINPTKI